MTGKANVREGEGYHERPCVQLSPVEYDEDPHIVNITYILVNIIRFNTMKL